MSKVPKIFKSFQWVAHRGFRNIYPENSMEAFRGAIQNGATMIEFDVQLSRDGVPIVFHDENLYRMCGLRKNINELTCQKLEEMKLSSTVGDMSQEARIPTLETVFKNFKANIYYYVELKTFFTTSHLEKENLCVSVLKLIKKFALQTQVMYASFDIELLKRVPQKNVDLLLGLNIDNLDVFQSEQDFIKKYIQVICPHHSLLSPIQVDSWREQGFEICPWGFLEKHEIKRAMKYPLSGITLDEMEK